MKALSARQTTRAEGTKSFSCSYSRKMNGVEELVTAKKRARVAPPERVKRDFQQIFCETNSIPAGEYEIQLFKRCLYRHARLFAPILLRLKPEMFLEDFAVIREVANVTCPDVFQMEISRFDGRNKRDHYLLRKLFLIRVSGKRLLKWKVRCLKNSLELTEVE